MNEAYNSKLEDLKAIKAVFESLNVRVILVYGALLGMHRDGKLIEHDDDIDLACVEPIDLETRKKIGWMLYDLGFEKQPIAFNVFGRMEECEEGYSGTEETGIIVCKRNFNFTIFFFKEEQCEKHGAEYVCIPKLGAMKLISTPKKFFEKSGTVKIGKEVYFTPYPVEDYLKYSYINWKDKNGRDHSPTYNQNHPI